MDLILTTLPIRRNSRDFNSLSLSLFVLNVPEVVSVGKLRKGVSLAGTVIAEIL